MFAAIETLELVLTRAYLHALYLRVPVASMPTSPPAPGTGGTGTGGGFDWTTQPMNDLEVLLAVIAGGGAVVNLIKAVPHTTNLENNTGHAVKGIGANLFGFLLCLAIAGGSLIAFLKTATPTTPVSGLPTP